MAPGFSASDEASPPLAEKDEIRVLTAGTWVGLGSGILVVAAGFVWTIL